MSTGRLFRTIGERLNVDRLISGIADQLRDQTPAHRLLRALMAVAMAAALVLTVLAEWEVQLFALGIAVVGALLAVLMPNSLALLVFLVGVLANWVLRSTGELGPLPIALGAALLVVVFCAVGCTFAAPDVQLPGRVWRRLSVAGLLGFVVLAGTTASLYGLLALRVPGPLPLLLLGVLLVPITVWAMVGRRAPGKINRN